MNKSYNKGRNNPRYIDNRTNLKHYCKDCKKLIKNIYAKRCQSCSKKELYKDITKNPLYIDGRSYIPYPKEFSKALRKKILKRDKYKCKKCGMINKKHLKKYKRNLHIHHIDYDKTNCKENNLITLCFDCNIRVNFNRDYWFAYFTYIMENK